MPKHIHTSPSSSRNIIHLGAVVSTQFPLQEKTNGREFSHMHSPHNHSKFLLINQRYKKNAQQASKYLKAGQCEYLNQWVLKLYL